MGDLKDFILAGHSFGGYVVGNYAIRFPQYIKKLLMLSPVGVSVKPDGFELGKMRSKEGRGPPPRVLSLVKHAWGEEVVSIRSITWLWVLDWEKID
jgi:pimeloyl-ACP methyl ester carboxylesterase